MVWAGDSSGDRLTNVRKALLSWGVSLLALPSFVLAADVEAPGSSVDATWSASLTLNEYYTDNVFFSRPLFDEKREHDWVTVFLPALDYTLRFRDSSITLGGSGEIGRFARHSSEDYEDFRLFANGRHRFDPTSLGVWGATVLRDHEPRSSPEPSDQVGDTPTVYWQASSYAALSRSFGTSAIRLGATHDYLDFEDTPTSRGPGSVNNDDRGRHMVTTGARFSADFGPASRIYAEGSFDGRQYVRAVDDFGFDRNSFGARAILGWQREFGPTLDTGFYGGVILQRFDDDRFSDVLAPDYGGLLRWRPLPGTVVRAQAARSLEETTLPGVSSYLRTTASLNVSQLVRDDLRLYGGASAAMLDFQDAGREDQIVSAWLGVRRYVAPRVFIGAEAAYQERESNEPTNDYTENRIMVRAGVESGPAFDEAGLAAAPAFGIPSVYLGVRGGVSSLASMLDGPRQHGQDGSLTADFGDFGWGGNVFAGVGTELSRWYIGLEADGGIGPSDWDHSRLPGGRVFSVERRENYGVSGLLGRILAGNNLVYGRAGPRWAVFKTHYATPGQTLGDERTELGFEYGIGLRAPASQRLAVSVDYVHAAFDDFTFGTGQRGPDRIANTESRAMLGLSYQLNPGAAATELPPMRDYGGFYWGLQAGHGMLASLTTGDRQEEGDPPTPSVLNADFGDTGFTIGGFAGWNYQSGRFVLGGELDTEMAEQEWNHERQPGGRTFSLEKKFSAGAALRAGAVLGGGALLYGRLGVVGTLFEQDFSTSEGTLEREDWDAALRYGSGMEVPVNDGLALRFDYTHTDYGVLRLRTPSSVETHDTRESLFRLGAVLKM
jgi:opacity protein-like surface antigen